MHNIPKAPRPLPVPNQCKRGMAARRARQLALAKDQSRELQTQNCLLFGQIQCVEMQNQQLQLELDQVRWDYQRVLGELNSQRALGWKGDALVKAEEKSEMDEEEDRVGGSEDANEVKEEEEERETAEEEEGDDDGSEEDEEGNEGRNEELREECDDDSVEEEEEEKEKENAEEDEGDDDGSEEDEEGNEGRNEEGEKCDDDSVEEEEVEEEEEEEIEEEEHDGPLCANTAGENENMYNVFEVATMRAAWTRGFETEIQALRVRCEEARGFANERLYELESVQEQLDDARGREAKNARTIYDQELKITAIENELSHATAEVAKAKMAAVFLKAQLEEVAQFKSALEAEKEELGNDLSEMQTELEDTAERLAASEDELESTKAQLVMTEGAQACTNTKYLKMAATNRQLQIQIAESESIAHDYATRWAQAEDQLKDTTERLDDSDATLEDVSKKLSEAEDELEDVKTHSKHLQEQFVWKREGWVKEKVAYEERLRNHFAKEQEQSRHRTNADRKWERVRRQISDLKAELDDETAKNVALEEEVSQREVKKRKLI